MPTQINRKPSLTSSSKSLKADLHSKTAKKSNQANSNSDISQKLIQQIHRTFDLQKDKSIALRHSTPKERIEKLNKIHDLILKYQPQIQEALRKDFNKSEAETDITEILPTIGECKDAIRHLKYWMKPQRVSSPITMFGATSEIHYEPKGRVLIISPWNYPFHLAFAPILAAIAAGNTVILKPSEFTPAVSSLTKQMLSEIFQEDEVAVIEGDFRVSTILNDLPFDHIFFTGSTHVGKIIMERAAKNLTSVTLELGGKSPAIITEEANISHAAESLIWGKFLNAGQTCVAPDYLFVPESKKDEFVQKADLAITKFFGKNSANKSLSKDFCRIINERNFQRITGYIDDAVKHGAKIELGGEFIAKENFISPTLISNLAKHSHIMHDEIFGPVLPILTYSNLTEVIDFINNKPKPLAMYIFANEKDKIKHLLKSTSSGGAVVNDVIIHLANSNLPFGGVNHSGMGSYHGVFGFKQFSHERSVLKQAPISSVKMMYPPYTNFVKKLVAFTTKFFL
jgi:aldehyde dehydrogenase (NAD+)